MSRYKVTISNQLKNSLQMLLYTFGLTGLIIFYLFNKNLEHLIYTYTATVYFIIQLLFWLTIHINYYNVNKDDVLIFCADSKKYTFKHGVFELIFNIDDIEYVVLNKSFALHKKNIKLLAWDDYNHALIFLKNGQRVVITSLLIGGEIIMPIENEKIKVKQNLFRWVSGPSCSL